jgi:TolB-like protein/DNA-binding winged helix-turn-helix (wHTH) protein/Tfp pilus assembly protein PilF
MTDHQVWTFDDFELDLAAWQLTRAGRPLPIEPKGLALLALLIERRGEVVSKADILDAVWADATVTENAMVRVVAHLRGLLGDDAKDPKYIETVHTRGYRFVAPVARRVPLAPASSGPSLRRPARLTAAVILLVVAAGIGVFVARGDRPPARPATTIDASIAILPLENLGPPAQQYFADGMTEALTTQLARIEALKVIARGAVVRFADERPPPAAIARELGVAWLVEGSVLLAGEQVRITTRLVDGASNQTLWGDFYDGEIHDILALQARVARDIVSEIRVRTTRDEEQRLVATRAVNPAAYQEYLRGLFSYEESMRVDDRMFASLREAQAHFEAAVALQPDWGEALGALAQTHLRLAGMLDDHEQRMRHLHAGREFTERALARDPHVVAGHLARARTAFFLDGDWERAERSYREVLRLEPNNADWSYGTFLMSAGRFDEGIARLRYALERWPTSTTVRFWLAWSCVCAGRYDEARAEAEELRARLSDEPHAALIEAMILGRTGRYLEAIERLEAERDALLVNRATSFLQELSYVAAKAGDLKRAKQAIAQLEAMGGRARVDVLVAMGATAGAVARIQQLHAQRDYALLQLRCSPEYENLRRIPEVDRIYREVGPPNLR